MSSPAATRGSGDRPVGTAFQCENCASRWYWAYSGSWVLLLPVVRGRRPSDTDRRWWSSLVEAIAQWRTRRRLRDRRAKRTQSGARRSPDRWA